MYIPTSGLHLTVRFFVVIIFLINCYLERTDVFALKFQTSNLNAGRARLVLYQGKVRHEVIGRSCPVGLAFTSPQLFSCACVTGVWAFYDIMCAPPLQIIGGVNHCFKMPLDTYIQEAMLLSNPTRAHGDALTAFNGDMESVQNKFFRETHSQLKTPGHLLTVGPTWTLRGVNGSSKDVCLDSSKNKIFDDPEQSSLASAYCNFANVSKSIPNIGSVTVGCKDNVIRHHPEHCYPFLDSNSEEICTDLSLLEAYEMAVEQENNDLPHRNTTNREFKRLVKTQKKKLVQTSTTTTTPSTTVMTTVKPKKLVKKVDHSPLHVRGKSLVPVELEERSNNLIDNPGDKGRHERGEMKDSKKIPNLTSDPLLNDESYSDEDDSADVDDGSVTPKNNQQIANTDDMANSSAATEKDPTLLDEAAMKRIYKEIVQDQGNFLVLSGSDSDKVVLTHVWEYQQEQIQMALKLKQASPQQQQDNKEDPTAPSPPPKLQIREIFDLAVKVMSITCPAIPPGFLHLAMDTFINIQEKEFRWHPPFFTDKELDGITQALEQCKNESQSYNFLRRGGGWEPQNDPILTCGRKNPDELMVGSRRERLIISEKIKSDGFEPLIEAMWKVGIHAVTFCEPFLQRNFLASSKLNIAISEIFRNQIHLLWFRNKMIDMEYGGVLGDTKIILKDLDLCLVAAKKLTGSIAEYQRPEFVPPAGWLPLSAIEESGTGESTITTTENNQTGQENQESLRESRHVDSSKSFLNDMPSSNLMMEKEEPEEELVLNSIVESLETTTTTTTTTTTNNTSSLPSTIENNSTTTTATTFKPTDFSKFSSIPGSSLVTENYISNTPVMINITTPMPTVLTVPIITPTANIFNEIPNTTAKSQIDLTTTTTTAERISSSLQLASTTIVATTELPSSSSSSPPIVTTASSPTASVQQLQPSPTPLLTMTIQNVTPTTNFFEANDGTVTPMTTEYPATSPDPLELDSLVSTEETMTFEPEQVANLSENESESSSTSSNEEVESVSMNPTSSMTPAPELIEEPKSRKRRSINELTTVSRKRRSLNERDLSKAEENWRKQRTILSGMAICLKKFDEIRTHLQQECD